MNKEAFVEALKNFRDYMGNCSNDAEEKENEEIMMERYEDEERKTLFQLFYRKYKEEH